MLETDYQPPRPAIAPRLTLSEAVADRRPGHSRTPASRPAPHLSAASSALLNGNPGPRRRLSIAQQHAARTALDAGARPVDVAREYQVSVRTIYRYAAEDRGGRLALVELAGYRALVRLVPGQPPAFLSRWELAR